MMNLLPAILIGGPPHAGKSVLTYSLTQALRKLRVEHFVIRACPDGEGDWSQEIDQKSVSRIRITGEWTPEVVQHICTSLEHRHFPLLVDIGGRPKEWQTVILRHCTHSVLLLHRENESTANFWRNLVIGHGLLPLAELYSELEGASTIDAETPIIRGTLSGLERNTIAQGPLFDLLVGRIASLFTSYSAEELRKGHLDAAPAQVVDLDAYAEIRDPEKRWWTPAMLQDFIATLPRNTALAAYGRGTGWVYGALVSLTGTEPFYQFDSRLGWVTPPPLQIGSTKVPEIKINTDKRKDFTVLSAHPRNDHLDYEQVSNLPFPAVPAGHGLIINGKLPLWLVTALVRLYDGIGIPWIACYEPRKEGAIVVTSRAAGYSIGQHIPLWLPEAPM